MIIIDDSDANWWKGSNHRGEGLFPANFVSSDLEAPSESAQPQRRRSVQFNEEVEVVNTTEEPVQEIGEEKIDQVLELLHFSFESRGSVVACCLWIEVREDFCVLSEQSLFLLLDSLLLEGLQLGSLSSLLVFGLAL